MDDQRADLEWREGGVPVSTRFDDPYFSLDNGLAETRHVFLAGNGLPERFTDGFHIAELGFGTGLNLLATVQAFETSEVEGHLSYTSFEAFPLSQAALARALARFPELGDWARPLIDAWQEEDFSLNGSNWSARVIIGDARQTVPALAPPVDAWFLDGFSPAKNPELWEPDLLMAVGRATKRGGTFATYTAAGHVRRALEAAGFDVQRIPGFGRKRHMSVGVKR